MHHHINWSASAIMDDRGHVQWAIFAGIDISDQVQAERALSSEKERLAVTIQNINDAVITTDASGSIILFNKIAEKLTGWYTNEAISTSLDEVFIIYNENTSERCPSPVSRVMESGQAYSFAVGTVLIDRNKKRKMIMGKAAPLHEQDGRIIGVVVAFHDISEQRRMEEELLKVKKLDSLSILAGGIAHDFNNILTGILGNVSLARLDLQDGNDVDELLGEIEDAAMQAKALTLQLLTFSKGGAPVRKTASIADILTDTASFVVRGSKVSCDFNIPEDLWHADIDAGQISQVINNIIINAVQAMPDGGAVTITAENITLTRDNIFQLPPANYVKISIADTGIGIPKRYLQQIFDPYFTTKQAGSGFGLAISYSIIKKHGGYINVESELNKGTTFYIYLQAATDAHVEPQKDNAEIVAGQGRLLVLDDDDIVQRTLKHMLTRLGYHCTFVADGRDAVATFQRAIDNNKSFDAVILDLTIPGGVGGKEIVGDLRALDPNVKLIVASGYSSDPVLADFTEHGFHGAINKPFKINELSRVLDSVLVHEMQSQ